MMVALLDRLTVNQTATLSNNILNPFHFEWMAQYTPTQAHINQFSTSKGCWSKFLQNDAPQSLKTVSI